MAAGLTGTGRARAYYDTVATDYARLLPDTAYESPLDLGVLDHFLALLGRPAGPVLDAGCGTGRMVGHLRERGVGDLTGVDLSPGMVAQARAAYPELSFAVGDLSALPYADARFRGALAWYSIIHTPPDACPAVLAELARVLVPDGHLLLGFQAGTGSRMIDKAYGHDLRLRAYLHHTGYLGDALQRAGFDLVVTVDRAARPDERHPQGFLVARRRGGPHPQPFTL